MPTPEEIAKAVEEGRLRAAADEEARKRRSEDLARMEAETAEVARVEAAKRAADAHRSRKDHRK